MNTAVLMPVGWLIFLLGAGYMAISLAPSKSQVKSPTRRASGALMGAALCFLAGIVIIPSLDGSLQKALLGAAVVSVAVSMYFGAHARKVDRAMR